MTPDDLLRLLWDPTAPLPATWPGGGLGAFLLFLVPVGGGIPLGVLIARDGGLSPLITALLYLASDVVIALFGEPWLALVRWVGRHVPIVARMGQVLERLSEKVGLRATGPQGPLKLVLFSFSTSPTAGRAATSAAGHGFVTGWSLAITGDMLYFALVLASTLWLSGILGDDRLTVGIVVVATWVLPWLLRRMRRSRTPRLPVKVPAMAPVRVAVSEPSVPRAVTRRPTRANRKPVTRARGLHG